MALETLKGIKEIGGFKIKHIDNRLAGREYKEALDNKYFIFDNAENNSLSFIIQDGPVKENGVNGCQVDTVIETAKLMIEGLDRKYPCVENRKAISALHEALTWLKIRKDDREMRGVEGLSQK